MLAILLLTIMVTNSQRKTTTLLTIALQIEKGLGGMILMRGPTLMVSIWEQIKTNGMHMVSNGDTGRTQMNV